MALAVTRRVSAAAVAAPATPVGAAAVAAPATPVGAAAVAAPATPSAVAPEASQKATLAGYGYKIFFNSEAVAKKPPAKKAAAPISTPTAAAPVSTPTAAGM